MTEISISERPLMGLFGSESAYQVLMFLQNYEKGYASEIAKTYGTSLNQIQNQLKKFEELGILISRKEANARIFYFKRTPVSDSLRQFLKDMLQLLPESTLKKYYRQRRRPRRAGKK
jgi:DNA-binding MarR family transcriptional regulator